MTSPSLSPELRPGITNFYFERKPEPGNEPEPGPELGIELRIQPEPGVQPGTEPSPELSPCPSKGYTYSHNKHIQLHNFTE